VDEEVVVVGDLEVVVEEEEVFEVSEFVYIFGSIAILYKKS